jgi:hypothetical protein
MEDEEDKNQKIQKLLVHASVCAGCNVPICVRMKNLTIHWRTCQLDTCLYCERLYYHLEQHARACRKRIKTCSVECCDDIKTRLAEELANDQVEEID